MTLANVKEHFARLNWLASGEFKERDFDYEIGASDGAPKGQKDLKGWCTMGDFEGTKRKDLIISDAKRTLKIFLKKYPMFLEPIVEPDADESTEDDTDYSSKTKVILTAIATEKGLDISEAKTKDDLIVILEASEEA